MKWLKAIWKWCITKPASFAAALLVIVGGIILVLFKKDLQIGGLLGSLTGKKQPNLRAVVPEGRVDGAGKPILPGQSDQQGFTQAPVSATIQKPGLFSDPKTLVVEHPTKGKQVIALPTGVINKDVSEVIEISPDVYEVKNNDKSKVDTKRLLDVLK